MASYDEMTPAELETAASEVKILGRSKFDVLQDFAAILAELNQHRRVAMTTPIRWPDREMVRECNVAIRRTLRCRERARDFFGC